MPDSLMAKKIQVVTCFHKRAGPEFFWGDDVDPVFLNIVTRPDIAILYAACFISDEDVKEVYFRFIFGNCIIGTMNDAIDLQISFFIIKKIIGIKTNSEMILISLGLNVYG